MIVGYDHDGDVLRLVNFLSRNGHPYQRLDPDEDACAKTLVERFRVEPEELPQAATLFAAGLERQLARRDLPRDVRSRLVAAQTALWRVIGASRALQSSELWSWKYADGRYQIVPFGAGRDDVDESNAAQLWSTVYLAVKPPRKR